MGIAQHIKKLASYVPGEQPRSKNVVKLNTNENPYPPSPKCTAVLASFDLDDLRRYPDPNFTVLAKAIADENGTTSDRVFVGNGSDEILALSACVFVEDDESIGSLDPSYTLYKTLAAIRDVKWVGVGRAADDARRASAALAECRKSNISLFLWTNPNAPTGELTEPKTIAAFAKKFKGVVIVDEAYADFARSNCMSLATAPRNRNVIVMRTFSKSYSLAGLRVGYCIGPKDLIDALYKVKPSYNVDAIAQAVALAAFKDGAYHKKTVAKVVKTRTAFEKALAKRGWDVIKSESNFVFAKPPTGAAAEDIFAYLKDRDIYVRYFPGPLTGDRLRITIGTDGQMETLLDALDDRFRGEEKARKTSKTKTRKQPPIK